MTDTVHWAEWRPHPSGADYTIGIEEEVMLLHPHDWSLAQQIDRVLDALTPGLTGHVTAETHKSALELATGVHESVAEAAAELRSLRASLEGELTLLGLQVASAGTHPFAVWHETVVSDGRRYQAVYGSMRELAAREPTFGLHVHVGVRRAEDALRLYNSMRGHLPTLLALSANSPFWQGRDSGLASARTPLFQAFPRVGIPRAFKSYRDYVSAVDLLIRCGAFPEPTFLWWDVRPQPRFGTIEVRIVDAQTTVADTAALAALVQSIARLEIEDGYLSPAQLDAVEALDENRFLAARDGVAAKLIDVDAERRIPVADQLEALLAACAPHARALGCAAELEHVQTLAAEPGARRQVAIARNSPERLAGLVHELARHFLDDELSRPAATAPLQAPRPVLP
jgi:glutamate---cysteine ligase / carboxylate-amine ligase